MTSLDRVFKRLMAIITGVTPKTSPRDSFRGRLEFEENASPIDDGKNRHREVALIVTRWPEPLSTFHRCEQTVGIRIDVRLQADRVMGDTPAAAAHAAAQDVIVIRDALEDPANWLVEESDILSLGFDSSGGRTAQPSQESAAPDPNASIFELYYTVQFQERDA